MSIKSCNTNIKEWKSFTCAVEKWAMGPGFPRRGEEGVGTNAKGGDSNLLF